ncbi:hypothetical protein [Zhihengliuella halotolerans]|uniref:Uncharacterized protein n=1 Tax=Zhihengliuella halotolerans TaxID=370736 RepID=A0A4Q8ADM4_9MICC|nr:hypothetical protein [Zhihengliuella halotolerans]RZU61733.1 hypothetical protein EV380_1311 [Zhihengliuella halotolerans]
MASPDPLELLLSADPPQRQTYRWGTVTTASPVEVRLDGDPEGAEIRPTSLVAVADGDRAYIQIIGRQAVLMGIRK